MTRLDLREALESTNVQAFLAVLRYGLGTDHVDGYRTVFGGAHFEDASWHPGMHASVVVDGRYVVSTNAGAYRISYKIWTGLADRYGMDDFGPTSQDEAAVALIYLRGALQDVKAGRLAVAVDKCSEEWACLPGSPYGGPDEPSAKRLDLDTALSIYHRRGGRLEDEMPRHAKVPRVRRRRPLRMRPVVVGLVVFGILAWALMARGSVLT